MPDVFVPESTNQPAASYAPPHPPHAHPFATFCRNPDGVHFQNQEEDENILLFLRKHFITNVPWIFIAFFLSLIPFIFFSSAFRSFINTVFSLSDGLIFILIAFYYLIVFNYILINFITWFYNVSLVTNKRIVDIDFSDLVYHDVAVTRLTLVEDVNYTQVGFIRTLFNYGDAFVQTAGEQRHFDFLAVPSPSKAVDIIQTLIGRRREH